MSESTQNKIDTALGFIERLRGYTELDTSDADVTGYGAVTIAASNIAIAGAISDLADAVSALQKG